MIIKSIKKVKNKYEIVFLNDESFICHKDVIIKYGLLKKGIDISKIYSDILADNEYFTLLDTAIKKMQKMHTVKELEDKLLSMSTAKTVNLVIAKLIELKYLDDANYAKEFINMRYRKGYGAIDAIYKLKRLGVDSLIIDSAINENIELEFLSCSNYFQKILGNLTANSIEDLKYKIKNKMGNHGYSSININKVLTENFELINDFPLDVNIIDEYYQKALKKYDSSSTQAIKKQKIINFLMSKKFKYEDIKKVMEDNNYDY